MRRVRLLLVSLAALIAQGAAAQTVVPVQPIRAKSLIMADDLAVEEGRVNGTFADPADLIGQEAKVTLYTGRPILKSQVGPPALVERNDTVRMRFLAGPLSIVTDGRALDRGGAGETVRVMNLSSRQIVTGSVDDDGTIKVTR